MTPQRLDYDAVEEIRHTRGRSTLLFLTDRCPVGCRHCSVDSRRDSPTISDWEVFGAVLDWICDEPGLEVVGISGGEPFVERRGLELAVERLQGAGKRLVLYTSGVWATRPAPPRWIRDVLARSETVFLSTDAFHEECVADDVYVNAARAIAAAGNWIVVQVVDTPETVARAHELLHAAFGVSWPEHAEVHANPPLTHGRGAAVFRRAARHPGHTFPPCAMLASPMVRYDGVVVACCNESVIMGLGPAHLRRHARTAGGLAAAVDAFHHDPMLRAIESAGPGALTSHPRFADLAEREYASICGLCWTMLDRVAADTRPDPLIEAVALTAG